MAAKWNPTNPQHLIDLYLSGESVLSLSRMTNRSRPAICRFLHRNGITMRNSSEQERIKWSRMTAEKRANQVAAAHNATRNRVVPFEEMVIRAKSNENTTHHISQKEIMVRDLLIESGYDVVQQKAIGPYNADLTIHSVAVEIYGGGWHFSGRHLARAQKRFRYFGNAGWHIFVLVIDNGRFPWRSETLKDIIAFIDLAGSNPSMRRQYRMIGGDGQFLTSGNLNDDHLSLVPPFTHCRNPTTGRYERVTRHTVGV